MRTKRSSSSKKNPSEEAEHTELDHLQESEVADLAPPEPKRRGRKPGPKKVEPESVPPVDVPPPSESPIQSAQEPLQVPLSEPAPPREVETPPAIQLPPLAAQVLEALHAGRAVELAFQDEEVNAPRTFEPRQLIFDTLAQDWYIWGWDRRYNAERHHALTLLRKVKLADGTGRSAQGPFPEGTPANQIGGWFGGDSIKVRAILLKNWVFAVRQAPPPFPGFKLEELGDGTAQVNFSATDLRAIARWAQQFGDGIQIQEPQRLLDRLRQVAYAWGAKPESPKPAPPPPPPPPKPEPEERRPAPPRTEAAPRKNNVEIRTDRL